MFKAKQTNQSTIWVKSHTGTFIYALYQKNKVVHVGQCQEVQQRIDEHFKEKDVVFDRFTTTFIAGVQPFSYEANLMEAVAIARLKPETSATVVSNPARLVAASQRSARLLQLNNEDTQAVA